MDPVDGGPSATGAFILRGSDVAKARLAGLPELFGRCRGIWGWERRAGGVRLVVMPGRQATPFHAPDPGWRPKTARVVGCPKAPEKTPGAEPEPCA